MMEIVESEEDYSHVLNNGSLQDWLLESEFDYAEATNIALRADDPVMGDHLVLVAQSFTDCHPARLEAPELSYVLADVIQQVMDHRGVWSFYLHHPTNGGAARPDGIVTVIAIPGEDNDQPTTER